MDAALTRQIHDLFGVTRNDMELIGSRFAPMQLHKNDYLVKAGQTCHYLSFVQTGLLRVYVTVGSKEVTQWIGTPGYFLTDLSAFLFRVPARWNIQALADSELLNISYDDYRSLGRELPRWHEIEKGFIAKCFIQLEDRVFQHLHMSAEERYQQLLAGQPELFNQVPLQYLASMLGMTPETLSRLRKKSPGPIF